jgi:four helix bundle protein
MHKELIERNPVLKHSFDLALMVIDYCELLQEQKRFVISNQLLKSGTSVGANIMEAQNSESRADFIHKMKIAAKEAEETQYWLTLCKYSNRYPVCDEILFKLEEIHKLLGKILATTKSRINP